MKKFRPQSAAPRSDKIFSDGSVCQILRPSLWFGATCVVESNVNGIHRVAIRGKMGESFHADVSGDALQIDL